MAGTDTDESRDTEITLGTGKLLGIFFGLVLLCSVFFTLGYMLGRSNASGNRTTEIVGTETNGPSSGKPSAVNKTSQTETAASSTPSQANPVATSASPVPVSAATPAVVTPASASSSSGGETTSTAASGATYVVQVAAVSKREDADLLVSALQKKQYPVFVASAPGDGLFHVQVGPFTDPKDAETMRTRLVGEGYNPIVKK
jgi:cell division septation protein DedD